MDLKEAVREYVQDGCSISLGGIAAREPMAVTHEIIRQEKKDLTFITATYTDTINMLIGAGCIRRLEMAYVWIGVVGSGLNLRRAVEKGVPNKIEVVEYSNLAAAMRFLAGAMGLPFMPTRSLLGSDIPKYNDNIKIIDDPYGSGPIALVPAANPDVAFIHVQRADRSGNSQIWGMMANDVNIARAANKVVITCEEIVPTSVIRANPNMTAIPSYCVDAVVHVPFGCHPLPVAGYYWMDVPFRRSFMMDNKTHEGFVDWIDTWVKGSSDWSEYLERIGKDRLDKLVTMEHENYRLPDWR